MLSTYRPLFAIPGAWRFLAASALSRVGGAMFGVAIIVMIATRRDSFGLAGAISAGGIIVLAVAGPFIGRLVDKHGQRRASLPFIIMTFIAGLVTVALSAAGAPAWTLFVSYAVSAFLPEMGPMSRARWAYLLRDEPDSLHAAMSLEQVVEEGTFVLGPVLGVLAATMLFPEAGLLLAYVIFTAGSLLFLAERRSEPPVVPHDERPHGLAIARPGVAAVGLALFMVGCVFGGNEVVAVAVADEAGRTGMSSVILGAFALGSALSAIVFGTRKFTRDDRPALRVVRPGHVRPRGARAAHRQPVGTHRDDVHRRLCDGADPHHRDHAGAATRAARVHHRGHRGGDHRPPRRSRRGNGAERHTRRLVGSARDVRPPGDRSSPCGTHRRGLGPQDRPRHPRLTPPNLALCA